MKKYPLIQNQNLLDDGGPGKKKGNDEKSGTFDFDMVIETHANLFRSKEKILIISGDSYVHGDELADDTLPEYPNLHGLNDPSKINEEKNKFLQYKKNISSEDRKKLWQIERERSFPMLIQREKKDVLVINLAKGGESTQRNARVIVEMCMAIKKKFPKKQIEAILGLSSPNRTEEIAKYGYMWYHPSVRYQKANRHKKEITDFYKDYEHFYISYYDNDSLMEKYTMSLMWFYGCLETMKIKYHTFVPNPVLFFLKSFNYETFFFDKYELVLKDKFKPIYMLSDKELASLKSENVPIKAFEGHFTQHVHKMVKNKFLNVIFSQKSKPPGTIIL